MPTREDLKIVVIEVAVRCTKRLIQLQRRAKILNAKWETMALLDYSQFYAR